MIQTERLLLRHFTLDDAAAYWPLVSDPQVMRFLGGEQPQQTLDAVRDVLRTRPLRDYAVHGFGRMACIERSSGKLVGFCGLKRLEDIGEVDIGYRFIPESWGKGYATESARALIAHGIPAYGLHRVIAFVEPGNLASAKVLRKLGLSFERQAQLDDCAMPLDLYALNC